jgi:hypothetical protein
MRVIACALALATMLAPARAAEVDPRAVAFRLPEQIPWRPVTANGNQQAVLVGDPAKAGFGAGSFVTHFARGIHDDGAKDEPTVLLIVGEDPGTSTPVAR